MPTFDIRRAEIDSPNRCQSTVVTGQCPNLAVQDDSGNFLGDKCSLHGGHAAIRRYENEIITNYRLIRFQDRIKDFVTNPQVKSLREEIGILRILVEEKLNSIKEPFDLIAQSGQIAELCSKIERLVRSASQLEEKAGITLDRQQVLMIGDNIINAVVNNIEKLPLTPEQIALVLGNISQDLEKIFNGQSIIRSATKNTVEPSEEESD